MVGGVSQGVGWGSHFMTCYVIGRGTPTMRWLVIWETDWCQRRLHPWYEIFGVMQESINRTSLDWGRGRSMLPDAPFIMSNAILLKISPFHICFGPFTLLLASTILFTYSCEAYFRNPRRRSILSKTAFWTQTLGLVYFDSSSTAYPKTECAAISISVTTLLICYFFQFFNHTSFCNFAVAICPLCQ